MGILVRAVKHLNVTAIGSYRRYIFSPTHILLTNCLTKLSPFEPSSRVFKILSKHRLV